MEDFLLARTIRDRLEEVRQLLITKPNEFSLATAGHALESVAAALLALQGTLEAANRQTREISRESRSEISQLFALSGKVQALYRQARTFYGGLAAEIELPPSCMAYRADGTESSAMVANQIALHG